MESDTAAQQAAVRNMLAREEIRDLPYRYAAAIEARDPDAMAALYVPHARFGHYGSGREGMQRLMSESLESSVFAVILVANHLIQLDDESNARGQVWAQCFAQTQGDGFVEQVIKYEDRYQRDQGRWRFLHRRHRLHYGIARAVSPMTQQAAEWPRRQVGVGDLPLAEPTFAAWWRGRQTI
ncbi:nuclear transport factor 2 family protein [Mycobacterium asiaticum]|nr:nuclear transport factor 2 family protein [Mycobacterium asiaticum]